MPEGLLDNFSSLQDGIDFGVVHLQIGSSLVGNLQTQSWPPRCFFKRVIETDKANLTNLNFAENDGCLHGS